MNARPVTAQAWRDTGIAAALALVVIASRWPVAGRILYHWDSINFALALSHFDVRISQPHMPGYPLYVLLGRAVNYWARDAQRALVGISAVSAGLAVAALFALGRAVFDRATGLIAALLLAASPLFWFYGAIALPHCLDALMVIFGVWLLYRIRLGATSLAVPAALWLGVAGGLRPQTQVFLAPLMLYAGWRLDWRQRTLGLLVLAAVDLFWFVPLIELSGGWSAYFEALSSFNARFSDTTSVLAHGGWFGLTRNLRKVVMYTLYGLGGALLLVPVLAARALRWRPRRILGDRRAVFMALWIAPSLIYYVLIHMGQQGLIFVFLPALLLILARPVAALPGRLAGAATAASVVTGAAIFLLAPTFPLGGERLKLLTRDTLRQHDAFYTDRFAAIAARFAPSETAILAAGWRFPQYYLPQFKRLPYGVVSRWERGEGTPTRRDRTSVDLASLGLKPDRDGHYRVIVFEDDLSAFSIDSGRLQRIAVDDGKSLSVISIGANERLYLGPDGFGVVGADGP